MEVFYYCSVTLQDKVSKQNQRNDEGKSMDLTKGELKGDGLVSNFSVNHGGFKQCSKKKKILNFVRIHLDTYTFSFLRHKHQAKTNSSPINTIKVCVFQVLEQNPAASIFYYEELF